MDHNHKSHAALFGVHKITVNILLKEVMREMVNMLQVWHVWRIVLSLQIITHRNYVHVHVLVQSMLGVVLSQRFFNYIVYKN